LYLLLLIHTSTYQKKVIGVDFDSVICVTGVDFAGFSGVLGLFMWYLWESSSVVVCSLLDWFLHKVCFLSLFGCPLSVFLIALFSIVNFNMYQFILIALICIIGFIVYIISYQSVLCCINFGLLAWQ
jgi:hypothetical protein